MAITRRALLGAAATTAVLPGRFARAQTPGIKIGGVGPIAGLALLRLPGLAPFFVASTLAWTASSVALTLLSLRVIDLGGDTSLVGISWALNAAVEIPLMLLFPRIVKRFRVEWLIVGGIAVIVLRSLLWWAASTPVTFIAVTALSGFSFTFMLVGTTAYLPTRVPATLLATGQALFTSTTFAIGSITGAIIAGQVATIAAAMTHVRLSQLT